MGDHDPSGEDIFRDVAETLRLYAIAVETGQPAAHVREVLSLKAEAWCIGDIPEVLALETPWLACDRLSLTPDQIDEYELPVRPPKTSDVRTARFTGRGSVKVEALPVAVLLAIVEDAILRLIDAETLAAAELAEESEREVAHRIAATPVDRLVRAAA